MRERQNNNQAEDFDAFLAERLQIDPALLPRHGLWWDAGNTFGSIALKLNLIELNSIDEILERQKTDDGLFGEVAIRMGLISNEDAQQILRLQRFHRCLERGELLVVQGMISLLELLDLLREFLLLPHSGITNNPA